MQVAVLRLRKLVEDDPARPRRVVTLDDGGYGFGGDAPFRLVGP